MAPIFPPQIPKPRPYKSRASSLTHTHTHTLKSIEQKQRLRSDLHTLTQQSAAEMVVPLGPGKFYGSSLPRPRFYTDVKLNSERVDPPPSVTDPLMSWAQEAHWSMGGLNVKRHRLQGRIEGSVEKLRAQKEQIFKRTPIPKKSAAKLTAEEEIHVEIGRSPSPPRAPVAIKRRRVVGLMDEDEEEEEVVAVKRGAVRKLGDDFERVARESVMASSSGGEIGGGAAARTRSRVNLSGGGEGEKRKLVKGGRKIGGAVVAAAAGIRSSPRLSKMR
ncbi:hypothetical protein SASPL_130034 [Salvia splendens]|uniref:Uncharacterized protein n=1 Tax=Salvia splendens TaxID=180675 RepID=A0A8X8ZJ92_SALSN|nr:uncharacterized protein LOC121754163 [Salvia splendens]KAG6407052.1 hypothetical protein SASPL_130034 [Salvia splendens]